MPPHTRPSQKPSGRKRRQARQQQTGKGYTPVQPSAATTSKPARERVALEQIDHSVEYGHIVHDLRRIALWASIMLIGMVALTFVL
ncbi:MAG: hypothetical protein HC837_02325 [Chloroflexaceae bacterium]|nr:hypothetical protein [Chloroflexaceae bacterium]